MEISAASSLPVPSYTRHGMKAVEESPAERAAAAATGIPAIPSIIPPSPPQLRTSSPNSSVKSAEKASPTTPPPRGLLSTHQILYGCHGNSPISSNYADETQETYVHIIYSRSCTSNAFSIVPADLYTSGVTEYLTIYPCCKHQSPRDLLAEPRGASIPNPARRCRQRKRAMTVQIRRLAHEHGIL